MLLEQYPRGKQALFIAGVGRSQPETTSAHIDDWLEKFCL